MRRIAMRAIKRKSLDCRVRERRENKEIVDET